MIAISQDAIDKLKSLRPGDSALRISVMGGGCSGYTRKLEWVDPNTIDIAKDKMIVIADDLKIVVDARSHIFLAGSTLDYSDGLDGTGFDWDKPGAKSCGCGSSFTG